jgi:hypothetical protein
MTQNPNPRWNQLVHFLTPCTWLFFDPTLYFFEYVLVFLLSRCITSLSLCRATFPSFLEHIVPWSIIPRLLCLTPKVPSPTQTSQYSMKTSCNLSKDDDSKAIDKRIYKLMTGILLYVTTSRPDVMQEFVKVERISKRW